MRHTLVAAHTGCGVHPDNTVESFLEGMRIGADIVEVDVRVAGDGTPVLLHDDSPLLRTQAYEALNRPEVRCRLDPIYREYELASLEQAIRLSEREGTRLNLDVKSADAVAPAMDLVRRLNAAGRVYVTGCTDGIAAHYPDVRAMLNTPDFLSPVQMLRYASFADSACDAAAAGGYAGLNMNARTCRREMVEAAHARGLLVWVYTVNDETAMKKYGGMGVDAITTRRPERLIRLQKK
ncbi:glycerophosphodiester phosphodiesterase [Cohnella nanjingensis]|uniref:Glycerophosphodiester phosphodiesterase n=1 Tax=Cohnella nanjingensis TaxID=1387779 RepID=A0A7X0RU03_9BACL|nr:glycerophosphodiester phosphodiesterase [Cohnella nanjingensis]MBB6672451.1 glycerophosphodiester phosphodiesterase [Cohnella nanjingensis]